MLPTTTINHYTQSKIVSSWKKHLSSFKTPHESISSLWRKISETRGNNENIQLESEHRHVSQLVTKVSIYTRLKMNPSNPKLLFVPTDIIIILSKTKCSENLIQFKQLTSFFIQFPRVISWFSSVSALKQKRNTTNSSVAAKVELIMEFICPELLFLQSSRHRSPEVFIFNDGRETPSLSSLSLVVTLVCDLHRGRYTINIQSLFWNEILIL